MGILLKWEDSYSIGNAKLDEEHKKLFDLANQVLGISNPLMESETMKKCIRELYEYMRTHFKHEEEHMAGISFPELDSHKIKHQELIDEMNNVLKGSKNYIDLGNNLKTLMSKWVLKHIIEEDTKIAEW